MAYAARTLAGRAQSISEMREKLKRRAARVEDIEEALSQLKRTGYLNDKRLADSLANWRRENQGLGKARIERDLRVRRVAPALAKQAADAAYRDIDESAMIQKFLERKYRSKDLGSLLSEAKGLASAYRKLRTAGFSAGNSIRALKRYTAEAARLEELEDSTE